MFSGTYTRLSRFAGNLATCMEAGVGLEQALRTARRSLANTRMGDTLDMAMSRVRSGKELSEALEGSSSVWPSFFIPVLKSGERTGRIDEALRYLEHHCKLLAEPAKAIENAVFLPIGILYSGSILRIVLYLGYGQIGVALGLLFETAISLGSLFLTVYLLMATPIRPIIDPAKLAIPWLGSALREMGVNPFFHVMAMTYATAGQRVETMIRTAGHTVVNVALRQDLLRAIKAVENGDPIARAFDRCYYLKPEEKDLIATGDVSGTLEKSFERVSTAAGESLEFKLKLLRQFSVRITLSMVALSLGAALLPLLRMALGI